MPVLGCPGAWPLTLSVACDPLFSDSVSAPRTVSDTKEESPPFIRGPALPQG